MKCLTKSNNFFSPVVKRGQFQCIFICFSPGIAQEKLEIFFPGNLPQLFRKLFLQWNFYGVGIERYFLQLLFNSFFPMGVIMPDADYSMPAVHIEILLALIIPNIRSFRFYDSDVIDWIYIE